MRSRPHLARIESQVRLESRLAPDRPPARGGSARTREMQAETACERGAIAAVIRQADATIIVACGQRGSNREAEGP